MRVLILGTTGMLGHKLYQTLSSEFEIMGTIRNSFQSIKQYGFYNKSKILTGVDAEDITMVEQVIQKFAPHTVINCVGIIKSLQKSQDRYKIILINALFPHQLYKICRSQGSWLIQVSTDCVYSGKTGNYKESDLSDAEDTYGKTKFLGEIDEADALTIRTSIFGRELSTSNNLVEWLLSNKGKQINGYTNAIFSGFPTITFAKIIATILKEHHELHGVLHIGSEPISKYTLLTTIRDYMGLNIDITEYPDYYCDRSLDSSLFKNKTGFKPPDWDQMIGEFAEDALQYQQWRA